MTENIDEINKIKKKRGIIRSSITKIINRLETEVMDDNSNSDPIELLIEQLTERTEKLKIADMELEKLLSIDDLEDNMSSVEEYADRVTTCLFKARKKIIKVKNDSKSSPIESEQHRSSDHKSNNPIQTVKLPKLTISKFYGDLQEWLNFWNSFKSSIHDSLSLNKVDKFNYLKSFLGGTALETINGLFLSEENYDSAIDLLCKRFGDNDSLINAHMGELLKINPLKNSNDTKNFRRIYDFIQKHLRSLQNLGVDSNQYSTILTPILIKAFPPDLILEYNKITAENGNNSLEYFMDFLSKQLIAREKIINQSINSDYDSYKSNCRSSTKQMTQSSFRNFNKQDNLSKRTSAAELITTRNENKNENKCMLCGEGNHLSADCKKANLFTHQEKLNKLKLKGACFKCLLCHHVKKECRNRVKCSSCYSTSHLNVLCFKNSKSNLESEDKKNSDSYPLEDNQTSACHLWNNIKGKIYLQTLIVKLNKDGRDFFLRTIIDTASTYSFLTTFAAKKLKLKPDGKECITHGLFSGLEKRLQHNKYSITISDINDTFSCNLNVRDQPQICSSLPKLTNPQIINDLQNRRIYLSDLAINKQSCLFKNDPNEINLLIGADYAGQIFNVDIETLSSGLTAMNTHLGWTIIGGTSEENLIESGETLLSLHVSSIKLSDLWTLDSIGITEPTFSQSKIEIEKEVKKHFEDNIYKNNEGRYEVSLPFCVNHPKLPTNFVFAKSRLHNCVNNLKIKQCLIDYEKVFDNWLEESIIETIEAEENKLVGYHYLAHRPVFKENSTTKIRPVFDGSAKLKNSISLNECIEKGPNLLILIPKILHNFRTGRFGVVSDIKKAFLQISLNPKDRDYLRFLWFKGGDPDKLIEFRHKRVVFGLNASLFLLAATLDYHLNNVPEQKRSTAQKLKESLYVDNCVSSVDTIEELNTFVKNSIEIMKDGKFDLRGWRSNGEIDQRIYSNENDNFSETTISVLGLNWNINEDTFSCNMEKETNLSLNKRKVLSILHKLYDPLGFFCPVTIIPKLIIQKCWKLKISWDEKLPSDLAKDFQKWLIQIPHLQNIKIPRRLPQIDENSTLHVFCDASATAYASCIFLRHERINSVSCMLVSSRSRIAPVKQITIPRMELLACAIAARLAKTIKEDLNLEKIKTYFWSDSLNALYWIRREENWSTFVLNRVKEIKTLTKPQDWNHIPGKLNPADLPSRGCYPKYLERSKWWEGPSWLYLPPDEWPSTPIETPDDHIISAERRKTVVSAANTVPSDDADLFQNISNFYKILKVMCWIYRFANNTRKNSIPKMRVHITLEEIKNAEIIIYKYIQKQVFQGPEDHKIKVLNPIRDKNGIIRIKSRIVERKDHEDFRLPILLPSDHPLVTKLIRHEHEKLGHAGTQFVMSKLRERFWVLKSRKTIRKVINKCVYCKRFDKTTMETPQSVLPEDRVREAKIFEITGVDLTGPLYIKGKQKIYIVLFTCAVFRAMHLELSSSLTTESFIQAFRRFIARRGRPLVVYSDNGTNFTGTDNLLQKLNWETICDTATNERIKWKFIPPSSPWWGGWWERLIGVMKRILRKVLGNSSLSYESLNTVLCDCENIMNNRPLTYMSEDVHDLIPLTPAMFLHDLPVSGVPDLDNIDANSVKKSLRYRQKIICDLRKRFRSEYLGQLKQSSKLAKTSNSLKIGDLVLISSQQKRIFWPLARVIEILPSKDGIIRLVKVKTSNGEFLKTVQNLVPLELDSDCHLNDYAKKLRSSKVQKPQGGSVARN